MLIENAFTVAAPAEDLWSYLLDVERIAPCLPGAEITEVVDETTWKGNVQVKFGPVSLTFAGTVTMRERSATAHRIVLAATGLEQRGKGAASASVTSWLEPAAGGGTTVTLQAEITLSGAVAQLSRGLLPEVSKKLTQEFADCLEHSLSVDAASRAAATERSPATPSGGDPPPPLGYVTAAPVRGFRVGFSAFWSMLRSFFRRLFGRDRAR